MKIKIEQLGLINLVLQVDNEKKQRTFPLAELVIAGEIFKEIKKLVKEDKFTEGEIKLNSEQKVFLTKLIDEYRFSVGDYETVTDLKKLLI